MSMFPIASVIVGSGGSTDVTFSNIPSTFTHLELRVFSRSTASSNNASPTLQFNSDSTSANYISHLLYGDGSSAGSTNVSGSSGMLFTSMQPAGTAISGVFGSLVFSILDYANTNKNKTVRLIGGWDNNGTGSPAGYAQLDSGLWISTSAITSIKIGTNTGFAQYSRIDLYGISTSGVTGA